MSGCRTEPDRSIGQRVGLVQLRTALHEVLWAGFGRAGGPGEGRAFDSRMEKVSRGSGRMAARAVLNRAVLDAAMCADAAMRRCGDAGMGSSVLNVAWSAVGGVRLRAGGGGMTLD